MKELIEDIKNKKPIKVIYGGNDFGLYEYNDERKRYEGCIGWLTKEMLTQAIQDKDYHIKLKRNEICN